MNFGRCNDPCVKSHLIEIRGRQLRVGYFMEREEILSTYEPIREQFQDFLDFDAGIPYIEYEVETRHVPQQIGCLLVAESPPKVGYFYDPAFPSKQGGLRHEIFKALNVQDDKDGLATFGDRGFLLIDAVKLRIKSKKVNGKSLLGSNWRRKKLIDVSARLMKSELPELRFAPSAVVWLLGKTARDTFVEAFKHPGEGDCQRLQDCQVNWQDSFLPTFTVSAYDVMLSRMPFCWGKRDEGIWNHQSNLILERLQYRLINR